MIIIKNMTKPVANRILIFMVFYAHYFRPGIFNVSAVTQVWLFGAAQLGLHTFVIQCLEVS